MIEAAIKGIVLEDFPSAEKMTDEELDNECFQGCKEDEKQKEDEGEDIEDKEESEEGSDYDDKVNAIMEA